MCKSLKSKLIALLLGVLVLGPVYTYAAISTSEASAIQNEDCRGIVLDTGGNPVIAASVLIKNAPVNQGVITGTDGRFVQPNAKPGDILVISSLGFRTEETVWNGSEISIILREDSEILSGTVVTALGIRRSEKALSYNVQRVGNDALTSVKNVNFVNSLNGAVAGVDIKASTTGVGGATRVVMRGSKSITGTNSVLYVIDGVPVVNPNGGNIGGGRYSSQPSGEGIADINPEDIESINVLTGPSAAALYGAQAANGVIMINTKQGRDGKTSVSFSTSMDFSNPFILPEFQNTYGNAEGSLMSWGNKLDTPSKFNPADFFRTGTNIMNSLSMTTGNKTNKTYVSIGSTNATGILPNNKYDRYNFMVRNSADFLNDRLHLDVSGNYIIQKSQNMYRPGEYYNPILPLYLFPRGDNWEEIKVYKRYNAARGFATQFWPYGDGGMQMQNPYFIANDMMTPSMRKRYMFSASLGFDITPWMSITGRARVDNTVTESENRFHASGFGMLYANDLGNGMYAHSIANASQSYFDVILNIDKTFGEDFHLTANIGSSLEDYNTSSTSVGGPILKVPNLFSAAALDPSNNKGGDSKYRKRGTAIFASAELGWREMLYLTVTGRNDWSSLLVNAKQESVFYPSVGLSALVSNMVKLPDFISYLKVRGSYTEVGSPIPDSYRGVTRGTITYPIVNGVPETRTVLPFYDFKPERTRSYEFGLDTRLFDGRLSLDVTLYKSNTFNQTFTATPSGSAPYSSFYIQTGNIENKGIELSAGFNDRWGDFAYSTRLVYSRNVNKVISLVHDYTAPDGSLINFTETTAGGGYIREGDGMGDVYITQILKRDRDGKILIDHEGNLQTMALPDGKRIKIGSTNPDFTMGWRNDFEWKGINLSFLVTGRFGGLVQSGTQAVLDRFGVSKATADARDAGYVTLSSGQRVDPFKYYETITSESMTGAFYTYSATNIRLAEASIGYTLPRTWFGGRMPSTTVSLIGRNLLMIYKKAPFDPDVTSTTGTYGQGYEYFSQPSVRNIGFSLKVRF